MSNYSVSLVGPAPWGFRLQGGKDFNMPLTISRLSDGGKASQAHIGIGDVVLTIDGISTDGMTHLEAQNKIKACTGSLNLTLQRASAAPKANPNPPQTETPKEIIKPVPIASPTPVAPKVSNVAYNKAPKPFGSATSSKPASIPSASSAFTPASASLSIQSSPQPSALSLLAQVGPPPNSAPGLHANSKTTIEGHLPALSATKPAVNVPRQPASYSQTANLYDNEVAQDGAEVRRGQKENQGDKHQNGPPRKHIVDTYTDIYHTSAYSDASKKRLIDNTEDWHPRTGTTQSRSFRILAQMTGTEHMSEPEPENVQKTKLSDPFVSRSLLDALLISPIPKSSFPTSKPTRKSTGGLYTGHNHSNVSVEVPPATATSSKIMPSSYKSPPSSKPVTSKPTGWQTVPSSGQVTNNASNAVKPVANNKSVPPPWIEDQDTLVQRAEHIPAGTRTPMCAICNKVIRGPFLLALGKSWHPEEFNCAHCKSSMAEMGFVEEKGGLYCEICYEKLFAPECARCQRKILGEVINALKQTWHVSCFVCVACQTPIRNSVFHLEDGEPYCETDYYSLFGTICHGCEFPIEAGDRFLEALGHTWHNTCFVCTICCENLEGQTFFSKKDKLLCKKHAHSVNF
uniref:PDZ and LIM domain 5 n=1 Tax=Xenopus tropicalis TaxID=8364 RepID=A0A6I8T2A2_XENTR